MKIVGFMKKVYMSSQIRRDGIFLQLACLQYNQKMMRTVGMHTFLCPLWSDHFRFISYFISKTTIYIDRMR